MRLQFSIALLIASVAAVLACQGESPTADKAETPLQPPHFDTVDIPAAIVEVAGRVERTTPRSQPVRAFRLTRTVITESQVGACMDAGICAPMARRSGQPNAMANEEEGIPAAGVTPEYATVFCEKWAGGRLPTAAEWMLGARGANKQKYPWPGDSLPSCAQHGRANGRCCLIEDNCASVARDEVLRHPAGASPFGVEDVLLTDAELVGPDDTARCGGRGCYVRAVRPGRIDVLAPYPDEGKIRYSAGFRCAWDE